jgi:alpha-glucosidase
MFQQMKHHGILVLLVAAAAIPSQAEWTAIGDMPRPARQENSLRFENARAVAVVTALSPEVVRVRIAEGTAGRDHSYAVINRNLGDPGAAIAIEPSRSTITTSALRVSIQHAPFRVSFAARSGESLDEDDPQRGIAFAGSATRVWKRLRHDENVYGLGEKNGPLNKRGWKLGGYSFTMWNSDTFGYDASTDPLYVSVPFYMVLRGGLAHGLFLDNTFRSNFDIGHQTEGLLSFGAEGGPLDYYFIYGPEPKKVIERYTALTGKMPLPPLWALGYHQCRYSYYPESRVRFIAENFRERRIPADVIWLDIHYQDRFRPFTWDRRRFPDPRQLIADLGKRGLRVVTIVDAHPPAVRGYAPYESGLAGNHFVKNPDGSVYQAPVWPAKATDDDSADWSSNEPLSVFPDFSRAATREWWGNLYREFLDIGVAGIWNDMNEPAVFDTPTGTMPLDVRHHNEGAPADHRQIHNVYGMLMTQSTYEGLRRLRPNERPFVLTRASFAGGQRYAAVWPGDNVSEWTALRSSIPMLLGMGLSGFPFVGVDIGGFAEAPTAELFTRWIQAGVFYPFMRTHTTFGTPDQEPWSYGVDHEALNRSAIELRYRLLPYIYSVMRESAESGLPAMRPLVLEYPNDPTTHGMDDQFLFGSDLLIAPVLRAGATQRGVYLPAGEWYDFRSGERHMGPRWIGVPVTLSTIPIFVRGGAFVFGQPVVQHTGEMPGQPLEVAFFPSGSSERWLYEDEGNGFDYQRGVFSRRRFTARRDGTSIVVDIAAPEGSYRPVPRAILLSIPAKDVDSVRVGGAALPRLDDLNKGERGWSIAGGRVTVKVPDTFQRLEILIN